MPSVPTDLTPMMNALALWATAATGLPAYWKEQNGPAPPLEAGYVSIRWLIPFTGVGYGYSELRTSAPDVAERTIEIDAESMVSCQCCGRARMDAAGLNLEAGILDRDLRRILTAAGLAPTGERIKRSLPQVAGALWEHRIVFDFRVRARARWVRADVDYIEPITPTVATEPDGDVLISVGVT